MRPRKTLSEIFTSFAVLEESRFSRWSVDSILRRSWHAQAKDLTEEEGWGIFWLHCWKQDGDPTPLRHLQAYSQEACYWSAQRASRYLTQTGGLQDCFQFGQSRFPKLMAGFDQKRGTRLRTFFNVTFDRCMKDFLRQSGESLRCSQWALLHRTSETRLKEGLQQSGIPVAGMAFRLLAVKCFQACHQPERLRRGAMPAPTDEEWEAMVESYRQQRWQVGPGLPTLALTEFKATLDECESAIRQVISPKNQSLDQSVGASDEGSRLGNVLSDQGQLTPDQLLVREEEKLWVNQLGEYLENAVGQLGRGRGTLLQLYYSGQATQLQMVEQTGLKQYQISRELARVRRDLLRELAKWAQANLHTLGRTGVVEMDMNTLAMLGDILEDWLRQHFTSMDPLG